MTLELIFFYLFSSLTVVSGIAVLLIPNLLRAMLCFVITLIGVAVLFLFTQAEFLAVSQIMIYTGGILIILVFGMMLTSNIGSVQSNLFNENYKFTFVVVTGIFGYLAYQLLKDPFPYSDPIQQKSAIKTLGVALLTEHLFAFEAITILLTVALVGAAFISYNYKDSK
ncbi:MAG: NADH-quinone oxidoreductase subunit J [Cytophagales bacterium]|jgi:NADH:ubiquinone oxidoreductase subunit 6 (subunit J)